MASLVFDDIEGRGQSITNNTTSPTTINTYVTSSSGVGTGLVFSTDAVMDGGTYGLKGNFTAGYHYLYYGIASTGIVWTVFKFKMTAAPAANALIANAYGASGATRNAELRLNTDRSLVVRNGSAVVTTCTAPAMALNTEYRIAWGVDATSGAVYLNVYEGDSTTPWSTDSATSVSMGTTATDVVRLGAIASMTINEMYFDAIHIDSDSEWMPAATGTADYTLTINYPANDYQTPTEMVCDATTSTGTTSLSQTSGTTATINESPTGVFTITNPSGTDNLVFELTAGSDTATFTWTRSGGGAAFFARVKQLDNSWDPTY